MLKIRLTRRGAKKNPFYRIVVIDSRESRSGVPTATVGWYNPAHKDEIKLDEEQIIAWLGKGAQPTETVRNILKKNGVMAKFAEAKK